MFRFLPAASLAAMLLFACPAFALDEIYSPHSEEGELSLEYNGSRTFDPASGKNNEQGHEFALEYGVNSWLTLETSVGLSKDPDASTRFDDNEIEARFQLTEPGKYWLDAGLLTAYDFNRGYQAPDSAEVKLLLQKDISKFTSVMNVGFEQTVGKHSGGTGGPDYVLLWNNRYRMTEYFQPGIELQSDFGQGPELSHYGVQEHYLGPAVYGKLFGNLNYQAAWLAGISHESAQSSARILLEYEMHF